MKNKNNYQSLLDLSLVSVNGEIQASKDARIPIFDRGFLYGDSIYEVVYSRDGQVIFLDEHLDRLYESASLLRMDLFFTREELVNDILLLLKASTLKAAYLRIVVTRGETEITLNPDSSFHNNIVLITKPKPIYPPKFYTHGMHLQITSVESNHIKSTNPNAKSGNYLNNVMAMGEAKMRGADDAIMLNGKGQVTEGPTFNIWMVKDNTLYTPPGDSGLLKGITRDKLIYLCGENNISLKIECFTPEFLYTADEVFITSSTRGIIPVYQIDDQVYGQSIDDWPVTLKLSRIYEKLILKQLGNSKYKYL